MKRHPFLIVAYLIAAVLFGLFAWFQRNDIDPAVYYKPSGLDATLWFLFYTLIAVLFVVALFKRIPIWLLALAAIACFIEMGLSGPGLFQNLFGGEDFTMTQVSMSAEDPRVELSREFFGALIALAGVAALGWGEKKRNVKSDG